MVKCIKIDYVERFGSGGKMLVAKGRALGDKATAYIMFTVYPKSTLSFAVMKRAAAYEKAVTG